MTWLCGGGVFLERKEREGTPRVAAGQSRSDRGRRPERGGATDPSAARGTPKWIIGFLLVFFGFLPEAWAASLDLGELDLGGGTRTRPAAWARLLYEVETATSVATVQQTVKVRAEDPELFRHPLVTLSGAGAFSLPGAAGMEQLSRFLAFGGLLFVDGAGDGAWDASVRALAAALFPTRPLAPLSSDHSLYRTFFMVERPLGRLAGGDLEGVTVGRWTPLVVSRVDLAGALEPGAGPCIPGGEEQRREAIKMGINLVMYALTANYKRDQIHVQELMREGKL